VSDTGKGMPEHVREKAFEPFFTTKVEQNSAGLGLAMAYGTVEGHGGWISCESALNEGSTFRIYLPRCEQRNEPMVIHRETQIKGGRDPVILVVDDESGVRRIAISVLKRCHMSALEALRVFEENSREIDLVLLDLSMPRLSGRETFTALKTTKEDLPILLCSGYPVNIDEFSAETGFRPHGLIQKPFDIRTLGNIVREAMEGRVLTETVVSG